MTNDQVLTNSLGENKAKNKSRKSPILFEMNKDGKNLAIKSIDGNDERTFEQKLCEITGLENSVLAISTISAGADCVTGCCNTSEKYNVVLQSLAELQPNDAHEARLSIQATVLYSQAMKYLKHAEKALVDDDTFDRQGWNQIFMRNATRLLDLHNKTIEALTRYRQRGEQRIVVQHINITDNAKAIVSGQMIAGGEGQQ